MRNNQPVTQKEFTFDSDQRLISATDTKGNIRYFNQAFKDVSGYSAEELEGAPHNLVRHPDMPPAVYKNMWDTLQQGKPWMGLVKNRRKNGDHYWVSAYVTPMYDGPKIVGYESVRVVPEDAQKVRAGRVYKRMKAGKSPFSILQHTQHFLRSTLSTWLPAAIATLVAGIAGLTMAAAFSAVLGLIILGANFVRKELDYKGMLALRPNAFNNRLVAYTYSADSGNKAQVEMMIRSEAARARTGLTRIEDAAASLGSIVNATREQAAASSVLIDQQNDATQQTASAINQMSTSIQEVADSVEANAEKSEAAATNVDSSSKLAAEALVSINELSEAVKSIVATVNELAESTSDIGQAADLISAVAEQTNLLALNAAIEAARAGEHGRGFSVVADEVRALAGKTRQSTDRIHDIIDVLVKRSENAVEVSKHGEEAAHRGVDMVSRTEQALGEIREAVEGINEMTIQMSSAVEEQSSVAEHINQQVTHMADGAVEAKDNANETAQASQRLQHTADELHALVKRFAQGG
ncbi:methyl-accepting chemotaxis protein [Aliidiomarina sp. Khilg15.8]